MTVAERRIEVLVSLEQGIPARDIARRLGVPLRTVIADRLALVRDGIVITRRKR